MIREEPMKYWVEVQLVGLRNQMHFYCLPDRVVAKMEGYAGMVYLYYRSPLQVVKPVYISPL